MANTNQRQMLVANKRTRSKKKLDPVSMLLVLLLLVGLASICITLATVMMPSTDEVMTDQTERTREAQRSEIERLQSELENAQHAPTPVRVAASLFAEPPLALIWDVPIYRQQHSLSCESSAAAMAAQFYNVPLSEADILAALPRHENPHLGFRGNIDGPYGGTTDYGVYAEPIRQVLSDFGLPVEHFSGSIETLKEHIRRGQVIIAWVTFDLQVQYPQQTLLSDGTSITLVPYEHAILIIGYNRNGLWINDPYSGTQQFYLEGDFVRSWSTFGNMGLVVGPQ